MAQLAYTEKRPRCMRCRLPSFGAYVVTFIKDGELIEEFAILCSECSFNLPHTNGFGAAKKFKAIRLEVVFKLPPKMAPPPPLPIVPFEDDFVPGHYDFTFMFEGDVYKADLGDFPTEWAAMERARQITHLTAKQMRLRNFWCLQHAINRRSITKEDSDG